LLQVLLAPDKIPGWLGVFLGILFAVSNWKGAFETLIATVSVAGWVPVAMIETFSSPIMSILLVFWGSFYLWVKSSAQMTPSDQRFFQFMGWLIPLMFIIPLSSVALFGYMISTSRIPELVRFVDQQNYERHLDKKGYKEAYAILRAAAKDMPETEIYTVRSPEASQYSVEIVELLKDAGVRLSNNIGSHPPIQDASSPHQTGVAIFAKDNFAAHNAAISLRDALALVKVEVGIGSGIPNDLPDHIIIWVLYH